MPIRTSPKTYLGAAGSGIGIGYKLTDLRRRIVRALAGGMVLSSTFLAAATANELKRIEENISRWIELQKKIADERNAWKADREILEQNLFVLKSELAELQDERDFLQEDFDRQDVQRERVAGSLDQEKLIRDRIQEHVETNQQRLFRLIDFAPPYLEKEMRQAKSKLESLESNELGQRFQAIVTALIRFEEFNRSITVDYVPRQMPDGREVMVHLLYWGLAGGYAVDEKAEMAWSVTPAEGGWVWKEQPEFAKETLQLIEIQEQRRPPELIALPAPISSIE